MKKKIIILSIILGVIAFILSWTFRYEISLSRGKFSANLVKHYLPDGVEVMDITGKNNLVIPKLPRRFYDDDYDWLETVSYGNTVLAVRNELISIINEHDYTVGRIDVYEFHENTNSFELKDEILPHFTLNHHKDEKDQFHSNSIDSRSLGFPIILYDKFIIADLGQNNTSRNIPEVEGITDKRFILNKLKEIDYIFDEIVLYKYSNSKWELSQIINYDLGNDASIIDISDGKISIYPPPDFGDALAMTDNYLLTVDTQGHNQVYIYKKVKNDKFALHSTSYNGGYSNNYILSPTHYLRTVDHGFSPQVQIINNESSVIEAEFTSPLHPDNVAFGETMAFTEDNLAIIGEPLYGSGSFSYPETESFIGGYPGFVHIYKQNETGEWKLLQTLSSPLGIHYEQFGIQIASNKNHLLIASQPSDYKHRKIRPGFGYIYEKQDDDTYKLIKVIFGNPSKNSKYSFSFGFDYVNFLHNGILYENTDGICYIPDVFRLNEGNLQ